MRIIFLWKWVDKVQMVHIVNRLQMLHMVEMLQMMMLQMMTPPCDRA